MYTSGYSDRAAQLRKSCERIGLPYALHEVEAVHNSISTKGSPDLRFTKANFIRQLLERHQRPILYVDADCVVRAYPALIDKLIDDGTTFAIYNWLADANNESFCPVDIRLNGQIIADRFFAYSHRVDRYSTEQLICSGAVQLFDASPAASALLAMWHETIENYPGVADDECLDFAFNNGGAGLSDIRWSWLPKEYSRACWWIGTKPILDHPDLPGGNEGMRKIPSDGRLRRVYGERCVPTVSRFPENAIIDVVDRLLYVYDDGRLSLAGPLDLEFWIAAGNRASATIDVTETWAPGLSC